MKKALASPCRRLPAAHDSWPRCHVTHRYVPFCAQYSTRYSKNSFLDGPREQSTWQSGVNTLFMYFYRTYIESRKTHRLIDQFTCSVENTQIQPSSWPRQPSAAALNNGGSPRLYAAPFSRPGSGFTLRRLNRKSEPLLEKAEHLTPYELENPQSTLW